jgi:hypothetical protein
MGRWAEGCERGGRAVRLCERSSFTAERAETAEAAGAVECRLERGGIFSCLLFRLARGSSCAGPMHRWHSRPHRQPAANVPLTICRVIGVPRQRISAREARRGTWRSCRSCCPGRWGSHRVRAGQIPGPRPKHRPLGIPPRQGRSNPRTAAAAPVGGDSTASRPVRSPDNGRRTARWGFHRVRAGRIRPPHRGRREFHRATAVKAPYPAFRNTRLSGFAVRGAARVTTPASA